MKTIHILIIVCTTSLLNCKSTQDTSKAHSTETLGYRIENKHIIFEFDKRDYAKASREGRLKDMEFSDINIYSVALSGEFNGWQKNGWKMYQIDENIYQIKKKLSKFDDKISWQYKFVINNEYWAEPPEKASNKTDAGVYTPKKRENLVLNTNKANTKEKNEPQTKGNTVFRLQGYDKAKKVVLTTDFLGWSESGVQMFRENGAWVTRLDLKEGKYLYKFIVDGKWITDPKNPFIEKDAGDYKNSVLYKGANTTFLLEGYPKAKKVILTGSFNAWNESTLRMTKTEKGWKAKIYLPDGKHEYKFIVDGKWISDPTNDNKVENEYGSYNSVLEK